MKILILAAIAATFTAGTALANEPVMPKSERVMERLDKNKDGKIGFDEMKPRMKKRFAAADTDGDKQITTAEIDALFKTRMEKRRTRMFELLDTDKNGVITEAEFDAVSQSMFDTADADKNGSIDTAEMKSFKPGKWRKSLVAKPAE
jgi:Ca2+-binding EF-hand superfamily protein